MKGIAWFDESILDRYYLFSIRASFKALIDKEVITYPEGWLGKVGILKRLFSRRSVVTEEVLCDVTYYDVVLKGEFLQDYLVNLQKDMTNSSTEYTYTKHLSNYKVIKFHKGEINVMVADAIPFEDVSAKEALKLVSIGKLVEIFGDDKYLEAFKLAAKLC